MKLIRNIFKSIFILIGIALLAVFACFAVMMIGKVSIFGYTFVNYDPEPIVQMQNDTNITEVVLNTNNVAVEIIKTDDSNIQYKLNPKIQGVFKLDTIKNAEQPIAFEEQVADGVLTINTLSPYGLYFMNTSKLQIWLPSTISIQNLTVKSGTTDVNFGGNLNLKNLTVELTSNLNSFELSEDLTVSENLNIKTNSGRFYVYSQINGDINIDSNMGTFLFYKHVGQGSSVVNIAGGSPAVEFGEFAKNQQDQSGVVNINGDVVVECQTGGLVKISGQVSGNVSLLSPNVELHAQKIVGTFVSSDGFSSAYIGSLAGSSNINKKDGYLNIQEVTASSLTITGSKNDVDIANLKSFVAVITNEYGAINVQNCNDTKLTAQTTNGAINIKGIKNSLNATTMHGSIYAEFETVAGINNLVGERNITAKVADNNLFALTTTAKSDNVTVDLGATNYVGFADIEANESGYKTKTEQVNGPSSNSLNIQTDNGAILVELK